MLFAFLHSSTENYPYPTLQLQGLDPEGRYRVHVLEGKLSEHTPVVASGAFWMNAGIDILLRGDFQAAAVTFDQE